LLRSPLSAGAPARPPTRALNRPAANNVDAGRGQIKNFKQTSDSHDLELNDPVSHSKRQSISFSYYTSSSGESSHIARQIRSWGTAPERLLRRALRAVGLRYRISPRQIPGRPDIAFLKERIAVFCDGDFWHGRDWPRRKKALAGGSNAQYWINKIQFNRLRDRRTNRTLRALGWKVIRVWETEIKSDLEGAIDMISCAVAIARRENAPRVTRRTSGSRTRTEGAMR
jgi:DNA mismatch endonuclease (patch repair protein)